MNVRISINIAAAILFCASTQAETPAPSGSTLDAAKRDLKTLPATESSPGLLGKDTGFGSASVPALTIPAIGEAAQPKPEASATPSPTWLQDSLDQTAAERGQRRKAQDAARDLNKPTKATDPLGQFLGQWLTPRDRELLKPDARKMSDSAVDRQGSVSAVTTPLTPTDRSPPLGLQTDFLPNVSTFEPAKNPYLQDDSPAVQPLNAPPVASPKVPTGLTGLASTALPLPSTAPSAVKPAVRPVEPPPAPPTAPVVDDRKYFPQLRRF